MVRSNSSNVRQKQKEEALCRLKLLKLDSKVSKLFEKGELSYSDRFGNNNIVSQNVEIQNVLAKFKKEYTNSLPYFALETLFPYYGFTMFSIFYISSEFQEWSFDRNAIQENWEF